jgi:hypothetical protein
VQESGFGAQGELGGLLVVAGRDERQLVAKTRTRTGSGICAEMGSRTGTGIEYWYEDIVLGKVEPATYKPPG